MSTSSEQINELAAALSKAQGQISTATHDGLNPHFKSKYSTLDSVWKACRIALTSHGLSVSQLISYEAETVYLTTKLMHSSGQWISSTIPVVTGKSSPQALGSALTYCKRYSLASMVGVTSGEEDDDANAAQEHSASHVNLKKEPAKQPEMNLDMFREFVSYLQVNHGDKYSFEQIYEYLQKVSNEKGIPIVKIIEQAKNPALTSRFCKGWETWYKSLVSVEASEE